MRRDQKEKLVWAVMDRVGTLCEFWEEMRKDYELEDLEFDEAQKMIANWMAKLPGTQWHIFFGPQPDK